jgi:hypothetical protein
MYTKITDQICDEVIKDRKANKTRAETVRRLGISKTSYDNIVWCYNNAILGNWDAIESRQRLHRPTVRWAEKYRDTSHAASAPAASSSRFPKSRYVFFRKVSFYTGLLSAACFVPAPDCLQVFRFLAEQLSDAIAIQEALEAQNAGSDELPAKGGTAP